jgi:hypothetical protein
MPGLSFCLWVCVACTGIVAGTVAQTRPQTPSSEQIRTVTRAAGTIFRGTVISVERIAPTRPNQLETVEIQFHVDEGLRGVKTGSTLRVREWAGLWTPRDRYRVGERVALFLYPPSRLGLTSPVGGDTGRFEVDDSGRVVIGSPVERRAPPPVDDRSARSMISPTSPLTPREFRRAVQRATEN